MNQFKDIIIKARVGFIYILKYFLYGAWLTILILFLIALISDISSASKFNYSISSQGIKQLFEIYSISIQLGTALLAISALILTLERMRQTRAQIDSIDYNYRFNNFYKHREEFIKYSSKKSFIVNLAKYSEQNLDDLLITYHEMYFAQSYEEFDAKIKSYRLKEIKEYLKSLHQDKTLSYNLEEYIYDGKPPMSFNWPLEHYIETDNTITYLFNKYGDKLKEWEKDCKDRLREICNLYYDYRIKSHILSFSGGGHIDMIPPQFIPNLVSFFRRTGLLILTLE